jgi:hypothetical protein
MSDLRDISTLCKEIDYLTTQVDTLRKERDEARRMWREAEAAVASLIAMIGEARRVKSSTCVDITNTNNLV